MSFDTALIGYRLRHGGAPRRSMAQRCSRGRFHIGRTVRGGHNWVRSNRGQDVAKKIIDIELSTMDMADHQIGLVMISPWSAPTP